MALSASKKIAAGFVLLLLFVAAASSALLYALISEVEVAFAQSPNPVEAREAGRKLKLLNEAQASKRPGFIRLSEVEINSLLQHRYKETSKDRTDAPGQLVKAGVLLRQDDMVFVTWHNLKVLGMTWPVLWQRSVAANTYTNGWSLALREMQVGKVRIPARFWGDISSLLGSGDSALEEGKAWLAGIPTVMLSRNEISHSPELRLYSYVPVVKQDTDPFDGLEPLNSPASGTNTLSANFSR